jgi:hypothetical protein
MQLKNRIKIIDRALAQIKYYRLKTVSIRRIIDARAHYGTYSSG